MVKRLAHISYHVIVVLMSAALALSVPFTLSAMAAGMLRAWAYIENEKVFLIALELLTAVVLILFFNHMKRGWEDRRIARMAKSAGLVLATPAKGIFAQRRIKKLKRKLGFARELMIIGSTGCRSFVEPEGDLYEAVQNCREAKIMLLDPSKEGAITRAQSIPDPEVTPEVVREQIMKSIGFLKGLRAAQRQVRLKLYPELPLLKLAIVGDYAFLQHYHTGDERASYAGIRLSKRIAIRRAVYPPLPVFSVPGGRIRTFPNTISIRTNLCTATAWAMKCFASGSRVFPWPRQRERER